VDHNPGGSNDAGKGQPEHGSIDEDQHIEEDPYLCIIDEDIHQSKDHPDYNKEDPGDIGDKGEPAPGERGLEGSGKSPEEVIDSETPVQEVDPDRSHDNNRCQFRSPR